ncbi:MAG: glycosyltransferase [Ignavibacteriae bacterium]|nr:MAG: glycosyltransferase [Ignavibacteriota bacterium]
MKQNTDTLPLLTSYFDSIADRWDRWQDRNHYYHQNVKELLQFLIPRQSSVLELGCATGDLLNAVEPATGVGVDISTEMIRCAQKKYPHLTFQSMNAEQLSLHQKFEYVVMSDLVGHLHDIQQALEKTHAVMNPRSRLIITYYNFIWEPILLLAEKLRLKTPQPHQNWVNTHDLQNLLDLANFEIIRSGYRMLLPKNIPILSWFFNKYLSQLPFLRKFCIVRFIVARPRVQELHPERFSVSIVIPARNERGNIEPAVQRIPNMGKKIEIIFVEGGSNDGTLDEIKRVAKAYKKKRAIRHCVQSGTGKANAVREGFARATGDILMILDADLTVAPEDLPKFYYALAANRGEFVNGSRLVYPMEKQAMRFLNLLGNKFFSMMFTYLLDQKFKDTLCGTKVIFRAHYEKLAANRSYFGEFDPFGDFDLIFGAAKQNLKIVEMPIRYAERTYGETNIQRWRHGLLLLKMVGVAARRLKFV